MDTNQASAVNVLKTCAMPLWVTGLAVVIVSVCRWLSSWLGAPTGETYEFTQYFLLATVFPCATLTLAKFVEREASWARQTVAVLALLASLAMVTRVTDSRSFGLVILGVVQAALLAYFDARQREAETPWTWSRPAVIFCVATLISCATWASAICLMYYADMEAVVRRDGWSLSICAALYAFAALYCLNSSRGDVALPRPNSLRAWARLCVTAVAVLLLLAAALRCDYLFGVDWVRDRFAYHHWGFCTGSAELVRQGGWLLWDVPSQYGFLSILSLAWLPFADTWTSLYAVNSALLFTEALIVFFIVRSLGRGVGASVFAFVVTLATVFLLPGMQVPYQAGMPSLMGPHIYPSQGAYRFWEVYALVAILVVRYRLMDEHPWHARLLHIGNIVWCVAVLWSFEAAVYATSVWLPGYSIAVYQDVRNGHAAGGWARAFALRLAQPLVGIAGVALCIAAYYRLRLGHFPDLRAYIEYSATFLFETGADSDYHWAMPIRENSAAWVLLLAGAAVATAVVYAVREGCARSLPLLVALLGGIWGLSSYFVLRSEGYLVCAITPFLACAGALTLNIVRTFRTTGRGAALFARLSFLALFGAVLFMAYGPYPLIHSYVLREQPQAPIARLLPRADEALNILLWKAGVKPNDALVFAGGNLMPVYQLPAQGGTMNVVFADVWAPVAPYFELATVGPERARVYVERFVQRTRKSGWLVARLDDAAQIEWLDTCLKKSHTVIAAFNDGTWSVRYFEYKGGG